MSGGLQRLMPLANYIALSIVNVNADVDFKKQCGQTKTAAAYAIPWA